MNHRQMLIEAIGDTHTGHHVLVWDNTEQDRGAGTDRLLMALSGTEIRKRPTEINKLPVWVLRVSHPDGWTDIDHDPCVLARVEIKALTLDHFGNHSITYTAVLGDELIGYPPHHPPAPAGQCRDCDPAHPIGTYLPERSEGLDRWAGNEVVLEVFTNSAAFKQALCEYARGPADP